MASQFSAIVLATRNPGKLREFRSLLEPTGWMVFGWATSRFSSTTRRQVHPSSRMLAARRSPIRKRPNSQSWRMTRAWRSRRSEAGLESIPPATRAPEPPTPSACRNCSPSWRRRRDSRGAVRLCPVLGRAGTLLAEVEGECRGFIAREPRGDKGFGYDPIFLFPELGKTYAELDEAEKNRRSHRGSAVRALLDNLGFRTC